MITNPREYREELLSGIAKSYREVKRLKRLLASKPLNRQFKNKNCKSAEAQYERRLEIECDIDDLLDEMKTSYRQLPEVRGGWVDGGDRTLIEFAELLVKPVRRRRFLRGQKQFT